jgi:hypothetical protein
MCPCPRQGARSMTASILNFGTKWMEVSGQLHAPAAFPTGKNRGMY